MSDIVELNNNVIVRIGGQTFYCEHMVDSGNPLLGKVPCNCNVFHHPEGEPDIFVCNSCDTRYRGD